MANPGAIQEFGTKDQSIIRKIRLGWTFRASENAKHVTGLFFICTMVDWFSGLLCRSGVGFAGDEFYPMEYCWRTNLDWFG